MLQRKCCHVQIHVRSRIATKTSLGEGIHREVAWYQADFLMTRRDWTGRRAEIRT